MNKPGTDSMTSPASEIERLRAALQDEREAHAQLQSRCYEGFASATDGIFDHVAHMRRAVQMAYGHLWHVNNEPAAPIPMRSPEKAAYEARKLLRELLTKEERGDAINAVGRQIGLYHARNGADNVSPMPDEPESVRASLHLPQDKKDQP